ncbi:extracellular solute-binding protein [Microbacterium sp. AK031]|uniref:extracellular solute-binding protein n=1 Tax=Microbacterium sp. AK031 TaxID=2723076 RepID=UPI002167E6BC|nr:extracellular solute-binding protein [Microbacterium sp. AK031]MCS3843639.1 raffinose/stachyose/melibiose transport system substrate-binding protein [Microbacterium sp. AK031]
MMLTRYRRPLTVAIGAVSIVALTACGSSGPGDTGGGATGSASAWALTGGIHEIMWGESFETWNEENSQEKINVEWFANDAYKEKIRTSMGAGTGPSLVFSWGGGPLRDYVESDKVVDLTEGAADLIDRVFPSVADGGKVDGVVYAVPNSQTQPELIYYNKDLFDQVGAEIPTTWNEVMDLVPKFNDAGIAPFAVAGASKWPELIWLQYMADRVGGPEAFASVMAQEPDSWSNPAFAEALTKIQELVKAGGFQDGFGTTVADTRADAALVHTGKAAMLLQGSWVFSSFVQDAPELVENDRIGFFEFPAVEGGKGDPANVVGNPSNYWSLSSGASGEVQEQMITYLNEYVFNEQYTETLLDGGGVPPVIGIEDRLADTDHGDFLTFAYNLVQDAPSFTLSWDQALPAAQAQELLTNIDRIFLLEITPDEFVANMNATL